MRDLAGLTHKLPPSRVVLWGMPPSPLAHSHSSAPQPLLQVSELGTLRRDLRSQARLRPFAGARAVARLPLLPALKSE